MLRTGQQQVLLRLSELWCVSVKVGGSGGITELLVMSGHGFTGKVVLKCSQLYVQELQKRIIIFLLLLTVSQRLCRALSSRIQERRNGYPVNITNYVKTQANEIVVEWRDDMRMVSVSQLWEHRLWRGAFTVARTMHHKHAQECTCNVSLPEGIRPCRWERVGLVMYMGMTNKGWLTGNFVIVECV